MRPYCYSVGSLAIVAYATRIGEQLRISEDVEERDLAASPDEYARQSMARAIFNGRGLKDQIASIVTDMRVELHKRDRVHLLSSPAELARVLHTKTAYGRERTIQDLLGEIDEADQTGNAAEDGHIYLLKPRTPSSDGHVYWARGHLETHETIHVIADVPLGFHHRISEEYGGNLWEGFCEYFARIVCEKKKIAIDEKKAYPEPTRFIQALEVVGVPVQILARAYFLNEGLNPVLMALVSIWRTKANDGIEAYIGHLQAVQQANRKAPLGAGRIKGIRARLTPPVSNEDAIRKMKEQISSFPPKEELLKYVLGMRF